MPDHRAGTETDQTSASPSGHPTADAVVVGGGIVGLSAALYLQRSGRTVTVVERWQPGDGASGHNGCVLAAGECVPIGTPAVIRSVPKMLVDPLSPLSIRWRHLPRITPWLVRFTSASRARRVEHISEALQSLTDRALDAYDPLLAESDAEHLVHDGGLVWAYSSDESFASAAFVLDLRRRRGVDVEVLHGVEVGRLDPALAGRFDHVVHLPRARFTSDPRELVRLFTDRFVAAGGRLVRAEVTGFTQTRDAVHAVETTAGAVPAGLVVLAAGAWSRKFARMLGSDVPLETERGYGLDIVDAGVSLASPVILGDNPVAMAPTRGGLRISGIDELAGLDAPPRMSLTDRLVSSTQRFFPELRVDDAVRWMSYRPSMPDSLPVIGRAPRRRNVVFAFGHGHKGLCLGAVTGRLVQEVADDKPPSVDLTPYHPARFATPWRRSRAAA